MITRTKTRKWFSRLETLSWTASLMLLLTYVGARADAEIGRHRDVTKFDEVAIPDTSSWSKSRRLVYESSLAQSAGQMLAVVSLPSVQLEVPLYSDTSELHLNRGVGLIQHTSAPGKPGNLGIAGHRDGFFRVLERVKVGDTIEVRTRDDRYVYRVTFTSIVYPSDARLLASTASPAVTLVTCYPFRFVGKAPQRFVVRGELVVAST
jgi:sortase A